MKKNKVDNSTKISKKNRGIGYKVFNPDWTCNGYQYKIGESYIHNGDLELCISGFHFCKNLIDCFNYYSFDSKNKVAIINYDTSKTIDEKDNDKCVTSHIEIIKEIQWDDVMRMVNHGINNTGHRNTGDSNTGHRNTGDRNTGHWNTGDSNTGDSNTGHWNTGDRNTGHWNTGDRNTGFFCENEGKVFIFDSAFEIDRNKLYDLRWFQLASRLELMELIYWQNMTDREKKDNPKAETTGGYLKVLSYHQAWAKLWDSFNQSEKAEFKNIPNFDAAKFERITGIKIEF